MARTPAPVGCAAFLYFALPLGVLAICVLLDARTGTFTVAFAAAFLLAVWLGAKLESPES
jgi:hypothetical protein